MRARPCWLLASVESVIEPLIEALDDYSLNPKSETQEPIFITGHSKGGAEAMLAAYILSHKLHPARIAGVYTFDQPTYLDAGARASYDVILRAATWRVVNGGDIVPQVPFWHWGYRMPGRKCFCPTALRRFRVADYWSTHAGDVTVVSKLNAYAESVRRRKDVPSSKTTLSRISRCVSHRKKHLEIRQAQSPKNPGLSIPYHNMISIFAQDVLRCRASKVSGWWSSA